MAQYGTNVSSASSVTGARTEQTFTLSISARPQVTYMFPEINTEPRMVQHHTQTFKIQGYNFDKVTGIYISGGPDVYTSNALSAVTAFDLFGSLSGLSALYPAFSGRRLTDDLFFISSPNTMVITVCATQNVGNIEVVITNPAGYSTLYTDLSTRVINIL